MKNIKIEILEKTDKELTEVINKVFTSPIMRHYLKEAYFEIMNLIDDYNDDDERRRLQNDIFKKQAKQKLSFKKLLLLNKNKLIRDFKRYGQDVGGQNPLGSKYFYEYKKTYKQINALCDDFITDEAISRIAFFQFCRTAQRFNKREFGAKIILNNNEIAKNVNELLYSLDLAKYDYKITKNIEIIIYKNKFYHYFK